MAQQFTKARRYTPAEEADITASCYRDPSEPTAVDVLREISVIRGMVEELAGVVASLRAAVLLKVEPMATEKQRGVLRQHGLPEHVTKDEAEKTIKGLNPKRKVANGVV